MKTILKWICCLVLILAPNTSLQAQEPADTALWVIETLDDNEYVGELLYRDEAIIRLKTEKIGEITIQVKDVKSIKKVAATQLVEGEYWFENPHATRYFWGPNGYGLRKGEGYYQNTWIFLNQVSVGVSDNFTLGLGMVPLFLFGGTASPVWVTPKVSIPVQKDQFNVGIGGLIGGVIGEDTETVGILYGTTTFGSRDKNASLSMGYGFAGKDWAETPTITFSAMIRSGKRGFFMTENYFVKIDGDSYLLLSGGGRHVFKKLALDYGGIVPVGSGIGQAIIIPWLGINVPFGNKTLGE